MRPSCSNEPPSKTRGRREGRVPARTHGPRATRSTRQNHRYRRIIRPSLRNGFNGVLRALLGDHAWLPPSPARRGSVFATLAPASERQDHTTSPSAQPPFVRAMTALGDVRPSHPLTNVRDDRDTPLLWAGTAQTVSLIWGKREAEYFCAKGWTGFRMRRFFARRANQSAPPRQPLDRF